MSLCLCFSIKIFVFSSDKDDSDGSGTHAKEKSNDANPTYVRCACNQHQLHSHIWNVLVDVVDATRCTNCTCDSILNLNSNPLFLEQSHSYAIVFVFIDFVRQMCELFIAFKERLRHRK